MPFTTMFCFLSSVPEVLFSFFVVSFPLLCCGYFSFSCPLFAKVFHNSAGLGDRDVKEFDFLGLGLRVRWKKGGSSAALLHGKDMNNVQGDRQCFLRALIFGGSPQGFLTIAIKASPGITCDLPKQRDLRKTSACV